jgi:hypothetical protein
MTPNLVGAEGFEDRGRWLVCVLTGASIDAERFRQDVAAYLRASFGVRPEQAECHQIDQAERHTEIQYRQILREAATLGGEECVCGAIFLVSSDRTRRLCPACRILLPSSLLGSRRVM